MPIGCSSQQYVCDVCEQHPRFDLYLYAEGEHGDSTFRCGCGKKDPMTLRSPSGETSSSIYSSAVVSKFVDDNYSDFDEVISALW